MSFHIGDIVIVNKDIFRVEIRDNVRVEILYASKGEMGVIIQIFSSGDDVNDRRMNAQVETTSGIMTLRLTSLDMASEWGF